MIENRTTEDTSRKSGVHRGRWTAQVNEPLAVFLIGMRVNKVWKVRQWWWAFMAMPRMLRRLVAVPELGLMHVETFTRGRTVLLVQYWRSFEHLERFARDKDMPHLEAWRRWNRQVRDSGDVGVYHETYPVAPGSVEAIYANMPLFGLAKATAAVPAGRIGQSAGHRLDRGRPDVAAVEPY
jgi:fumigallin biosynthesis monooxygenase-like protein